MATKTTTEKQLLIPALCALATNKDMISSKKFKSNILKLIKVKTADSQTLRGKTSIMDSRIDNIISHRSFGEYIEYAKLENSRTIYLKINNKGRTLLSNRLLKDIEL